MIEELCAHARGLDLPVEIKPVLHLRDHGIWRKIPAALRKQAVVWEDLAWLVIKPEHRRGRYPVRKSMGRETGLATFEEISGI